MSGSKPISSIQDGELVFLAGNTAIDRLRQPHHTISHRRYLGAILAKPAKRYG